MIIERVFAFVLLIIFPSTSLIFWILTRRINSVFKKDKKSKMRSDYYDALVAGRVLEQGLKRLFKFQLLVSIGLSILLAVLLIFFFD